jgi:competence protein ComEC
MKTSVKMVFWDVQHGHATYIKAPNGKHIVIDLGVGDYSGNNAFFSPLRHLKSNYYVSQLDQVIITHPHLDHIDDILNFHLLSPKVFNCNRAVPDEIILKGVRESDKPKYLKFMEIRDRYTSPVGDNDTLHEPDNWGGMKVSTFIPSSYDGDNLNNYSIITVIEYAGI